MNLSDLFPETMIVQRSGDRIYTTSLKVAEHFHKRHKNVLRDIEKLIAEIAEPEFSRLNFEPRNQIIRGRTYPYFELSEEAFALTAMGFTGREALAWKMDFIKAFIAMRTELAQRQATIEGAFRTVRPWVLPVAEATELGCSRADIAEPMGKSLASVTYHRRQARRFGLLAA